MSFLEVIKKYKYLENLEDNVEAANQFNNDISCLYYSYCGLVKIISRRLYWFLIIARA